MVGGQSAVDGGEFVYQDYLYDDAGTEKGRENNRHYRGNAEPRGDYLYPEETEPEETQTCRFNCADLLEFRAALEGDRVHFLIRLNTLLTPDSTVAAIALGPHGKDGGEPHAWPREANVATPGTDHVITVWGTGGAFDDNDLASVGGDVAVSTEDNAIEVSVPVELVGTRFRAYAGTGLWDAEGQRWMTPRLTGVGSASPDDPRAFNLAFRPEEFGHWYDEDQAAALAADDVSAFHADVDLTADRAAPPMNPGQWYQRIHRSSATIAPGEGVAPDGVKGRGYYTFALCCPIPTRFSYLGTHQPYSVYIPKAGYERAMLVNHPGQFSHGLNTLSPHYAGLAESAKAVMVTPLARGVLSFCTDYAHLDVMEAFDDALSLFPHGARGRQDTPGSFIDTDRNMLWGYSMGGLCTERLSVLQPEMFASAVQWAASTALNVDHEPIDSSQGHPANGNELDLMQNTRGIYWRIGHCTADEVAYYPGAAAHAERLEELGYIYNFRSVNGCDHLVQELPGLPTYADYAEDAEGTEAAVIDHNPARVTYTTEEGWWRPDISPRLVFDRAYWVSGLRTRERSQEGENRTAYGTVDAFTRGLADKREFATEFSGPRAGTMTVFPYVEYGRTPVEGELIEQANAFEATLTNLAAVTFDLARMGLTTTKDELTATLSADGPSTVTLGGAGRAALLSCDPEPCPEARTVGDDLVVALPQDGHYKLVIGRTGPGEPAGKAGPATSPPNGGVSTSSPSSFAASSEASSRTLPATGGGASGAAVIALLGGLLLRRRGRPW